MGLLDSLTDAAKGALHSVEDGVSKAAGEVKQAAAAVEKKAEGVVHAVEEKVQHAAEEVKHVAAAVEKKAEGAVHAVEQKAHQAADAAKHGVAAAAKKVKGVAQTVEHAVEKEAHHIADQVKAGAKVVEKDVEAAAHAVQKGAKRVAGQVQRGAKTVQKGVATVAHQVQAAEHAVVDEVRREVGEVRETIHTVEDGVAHTIDSAKQEAGKALRRGKKALGDHLVAAGKAVQDAHSVGDVAKGLAREAVGFGGDVVHATEDAGSAVLHTAGDEAKHLAQVEAKHIRDDANAVVGGVKAAGHAVAQDVRDGVEFAGKVRKTVRKDMDDAKEAELEAVRTVGHQVEETDLGKKLADSRVGKEMKMAFGTKETARKAADSLVEDPTEKLKALQEKGGSIDLGDSFSAKVGKDFKAGTLGVTGQFGEKINVTLEKGENGQPDTYTVSSSEGVSLGVYGAAEKDGVGLGAEASGGVTSGDKFVFHSQEEAVHAIKLLEREQMSHQREAGSAVADGNPLLSAMGVHSASGSFLTSQAENIALTKEEQEELNRARTEHNTTIGTKSSVSVDTPEVDLGFYKGKISGKAEVAKTLQSRTSIGADGQGKQEFSYGESLTVSKKVSLDPTEFIKEAAGFGGGHGAHPSSGGNPHAAGGDAGGAEAKVSVSQSQDVFSLGHSTTVSYDISAERAKKGMSSPLGDTSVLGERPSSISDDFTGEFRDGDTAYGGHVQLRQDFDKSGKRKVSVNADADVYHVEGGTTSVEAEAKVAGLGQVAVGYDHDDLRKTRQKHWASGDIPVSSPSLGGSGGAKVPDKAKNDWMQLFSGMHPHAN